MKNKNTIVTGIFSWDISERVSQRYGCFFLNDVNFHGDDSAKRTTNLSRISELVGKKVRLTAKVTRNRESGHIGDKFLNIVPSMPEVGETIEIGVGYLFDGISALGFITIGLKPSDGRDIHWINPKTLYRLHDQTVEIFAEETTDEETPQADFGKIEEGVISNGDGSMQTFSKRNLEGETRILLPEIRNLGDGLFVVSQQDLFIPGSRLNVEIK